MAVTKLSLLCLVGELSDFDKTLLLCIDDENFHIEEASGVVDDIDGVSQFTDNAAFAQTLMKGKTISDLLARLRNIADLAGVSLEKEARELRPHTALEYIDFNQNLDAAERKLDLHHKTLISLVERRDRIKSEINEDQKLIEQLRNIITLNTSLESLFTFEFLKIRFGHMPRESYDSLGYYTTDADDFFFIASSVYKKTVYGMYITPRAKAKRIDALFSSLKFERTRISDRARGTPQEAMDELLSEIEAKKADLEQVSASVESYVASCRFELLDYYDQLSQLQVMVDMHKKAVRTQSSFCILGWVPRSCVDDFLKKLEQYPNVICTAAQKKYQDKLKPPTLLRNPAFFKPFEEFVEMYGLPAHNEIDPTPFLAITYFIFFGMMFGDVGQGGLLILAGLGIWFLKKINLGRIISIVGLSSVAFGSIYGSVFGREDIIHGLLKPMDSIDTVLFGAVGVGVAVISMAMVINIINGIKQKDLLKVLFSHNGLAGLIFYWAVLFAALMMFKVAPPVVSVTVFVVIAALMLLFIFLKEPLAGLVARKADWMPHHKGEYIIENFFELFEVLLSFITNTISFIRIGAFALSHVGMMEVVFALAKTAEGTHNIFVLILGNVLVIGLEGLIVGIQVLRLEYYELMGRFFNGEGRPFEHLASRARGEKTR